MSVGAQSVLYPRRPTPETVFELIQRHRPTIFFGVPTLYAAMLAAKEAERADLSSLRLCVSAGEALPADLYRRWRERFGVEVVDGIGTTESGHIFLSNRPGSARPGSSGLRSPATSAHRGRRGPPGYPGRDREPPGPRRLHDGLLLEPARADQGSLFGSVDPDRRQVPPGRGRLLLVRRPRRRHAEGRRHLGLADRGRGHAHPARRGARGGRRRPGGRRPARQAARLCRPEGRRTSEALAAELRAFVKDKIAPTSTRDGSTSCRSSPRPPPARSSGSSSARARRAPERRPPRAETGARGDAPARGRLDQAIETRAGTTRKSRRAQLEGTGPRRSRRRRSDPAPDAPDRRRSPSRRSQTTSTPSGAKADRNAANRSTAPARTMMSAPGSGRTASVMDIPPGAYSAPGPLRRQSRRRASGMA